MQFEVLEGVLPDPDNINYHESSLCSNLTSYVHFPICINKLLANATSLSLPIICNNTTLTSQWQISFKFLGSQCVFPLTA